MMASFCARWLVPRWEQNGDQDREPGSMGLQASENDGHRTSETVLSKEGERC